ALRPGELGAEEVPLAVAPVPGGPGRGTGRRGAGEAKAAGGGVHGLVLPGRDFEVDGPHPGGPEEGLAARLLAAFGRRRSPETGEEEGQEEGDAGRRGRPGEESSAHRNTSRSRVRRGGFPPGPRPGRLPYS